MNHAMNSTTQAMINFLFMVSPFERIRRRRWGATPGPRQNAPNRRRGAHRCPRCTAWGQGPKEPPLEAPSALRFEAPLPDWPLTDWRHQVLIGGASPHHVGALGVWIRALGIGVIEAGIGANDHDVRPGLDPVVGGSRLCSVGVCIAGVSATGQHVHKSNFS